jgi:ABC-type multidrug transport system fused ATPase/permease subunit
MNTFVLKEESKGYPSPEEGVAWWNIGTYHWFTKVLQRGSRKALEPEDLYDLDPKYQSQYLMDQFEQKWREVQHDSPPRRVIMALYQAFRDQFILSGIALIVYDVFVSLSPILLRLLLLWIEQGDSDIWRPYLYAILIFASECIATFSTNYSMEWGAKTGFRLRTSITGAIYKKFFALSSKSRQNFPVGKIVNICATDTFRIELTMQLIHYVWASPILILIALVQLHLYLGVAIWSGIGLIVLYLPFQHLMTRGLGINRSRANQYLDKRMKIIHESLKGIRVIKAYAWEKSFLKMIEEIREQETKYVGRYLMTRASLSCVTQIVPVLAMIVTFIVYVLLGNELTPSRILPALTLFYILRAPMIYFPVALGFMIDSWIALNRIGDVLVAEELSDQPQFLMDTDHEYALQVDKVTFAWDAVESSNGAFAIEDLNLCVPKGKLVAIIGPVGAGKSSLLQGLVGDMKKIKGNVVFHGSIAYCQQQAWIQNATLRENILFGLPWDEGRYNKVIETCALERDLSILAGGDLTEIGEQGINLSGGQKQRLSLARAVYSDADIYIFDDPLSAVDAHVGKHLFEECIKNDLASKTRILVTHQLHVLPGVDYIYIMENGHLVQQGTYEELLASSEKFREMMQAYDNEEEVEEERVEFENEVATKKVLQASMETLVENAQKASGKKELIDEEDRNHGSLSFQDIQKYLSLAGGIVASMVVLAFSFGFNSSRIVTDQWLLWWSSIRFPMSQFEYIFYYCFIGLVQLAFNFAYGLAVAYFGLQASKKIHSKAIAKVFESPISFFDRTPLGRISSRFSRDIDALDTLLPENFRGFIWTVSMGFSNILLIAVFVPAFMGPAALAFILYYFLQKFFRKTSLELKRIDSITRSPILAQISETVAGLTTIRSFAAIPRFLRTNAKNLDTNNKAQYAKVIAQPWIQVRLELLNSFLVFMASLFAVTFRSQMGVRLAGLVISYALQITQVFTWTIRTLTEGETNMNSAERLIFYMNELGSERPAIIEKNRAPSSWPSRGQVSIRNLNLRYRSDLPLVLQGMNVEIEAGSKVGIIGRTGAGKSTILTALLRIVEHDSGSIWIDGINISELGLEDVRSRIAVIPQEPVLFSGTLRFNLDPFSNYSGILK